MKKTIQLPEHEILLVFGKTGSGKSYWLNNYLYNFNRVIIYDPLAEYKAFDCDTLESLQKHIENNPLFRCKFSDYSEFSNLCELIYEEEELYFCIEEAQRIIPSGATALPESFKDIVYRGRHFKLSLAIVSQRPSTVSIAVRSQFTKIICFSQTEPDDIKWLYQVTGDRQVYELPKFEYREYLEITPSSCIKKYSE